MLRTAWRSLVVLPALLLAIGPVAHAAPAPPHPRPAALTCGIGWQVIPNPATSEPLHSVVPIPGTTQLWAVGGTVIERWNGSTWSVVPTPSIPGLNLFAVSTDTADDAWAVAWANNPSTLLLHWNGTAWSATTNPVTSYALLNSVAAVSPTDAWAVGFHSTNGTSEPLMEHWNGTTWSVVAGPLPPGGGNLAAVARIPNTAQVVAVGSQGGGLTLIERWNEHQWTLQPSPNGSGPDGFDGGELNAVRAISPTNIWAAGDFSTSFDGQNFFNQSLIEHWDGSKWALSPSANVTRNGAPIGTTLFGITARSATDIWAVGYGGGWPVGGNPKVMVQHWNGATWSLVTTPDLGPLGGSELDGVAHIPGTSQVWAVGSGPTGQPLIEARC